MQPDRPRQEIANAETDASDPGVCGSRREPLVTLSSREEERGRWEVNFAAAAAALIRIQPSTLNRTARGQRFEIYTRLRLARPAM